MEIIKKRILESIEIKRRILEDDVLIESIEKSAAIMRKTLDNGGKILFCGNGGSASDAMHITGEIVGRFQRERKAQAAIALNADTATLTAIANDYGYETAYSRIVEGLMQDRDVLFGISTSGNSENIYMASLKAKEMGGSVIGLLGRNGGKIKDKVDISMIVQGDCTARIQEAHIMICHILCELIGR